MQTFELTLSNFLKASGGVILTGWAYFTLVIYLKRRKYQHIPGPPTNGFN